MTDNGRGNILSLLTMIAKHAGDARDRLAEAVGMSGSDGYDEAVGRAVVSINAMGEAVSTLDDIHDEVREETNAND